jgi:hypothetical protein
MQCRDTCGRRRAHLLKGEFFVIRMEVASVIPEHRLSPEDSQLRPHMIAQVDAQQQRVHAKKLVDRLGRRRIGRLSSMPHLLAQLVV